MGTVLLTIETKNRELIGKTWLAIHLLQKGHQVIFGDKRARREVIDLVDPDYCFIGGVKSHEDEWLKSLSKCGVSVGVLETEGAVFNDIRDYGTDFNPVNLGRIDQYFSWGSIQNKHLSEMFPEYDEKFITTGNPRFDLLKSPINGIYSIDLREIDDLRPFVLINTNFSRANHYNAPFEYPGSGVDSHSQGALLSEFLRAIQYLSDNYPEINFVIRPHPSESNIMYVDRFNEIDNIAVEDEFNVRNWIFKSEAVIHNGCTTGIESALMNKPTIAFDPIREYQPPALPNEVSHRCYDISGLHSHLDTILREDDYQAHYKVEKLRDWFHNLNIKYSAALVSEILHDTISDQNSKDYNRFKPELKIEAKRRIKSVPKIKKIRPIYRRIFEKDRTLFTKLDYLHQSEIVSLINQLNQYYECPEYNIEPLNEWDDLYLMSPNFN